MLLLAWDTAGVLVIVVVLPLLPTLIGPCSASLYVLHPQAVLTQHGGMTSHAAVVARGWGKPCVCGCEALSIDANLKVSAQTT
jgi:pyruvate,orthophosphate dikinase